MTHEGSQGGGPAAWKGAIADACCPLRAGLRIAGPFRRLGGWAVVWRCERYVAAGSGACGRFRRAIA